MVRGSVPPGSTIRHKEFLFQTVDLITLRLKIVAEKVPINNGRFTFRY